MLHCWLYTNLQAVIALFLLWDRPGVRRRVKKMPSWATVGTWTLNSARRIVRLKR